MCSAIPCAGTGSGCVHVTTMRATRASPSSSKVPTPVAQARSPRHSDRRGPRHGILFDPDRRDLHVAYHWTPILQKRGWARPTIGTDVDVDATYGPECWTRTVDLLGRSVHIDVSPDLTDVQIESIGRSIRAALTRQ